MMYFIVGPDQSLYNTLTMSLVHRLACASVAARSAVYVRRDFHYCYISESCWAKSINAQCTVDVFSLEASFCVSRSPFSWFSTKVTFPKLTDTGSIKKGKLSYPWNLLKNLLSSNDIVSD